MNIPTGVFSRIFIVTNILLDRTGVMAVDKDLE